MSSNQNLEKYNHSLLTDIFNDTIKVIFDALNDKAFKPNRMLNAAVYDSVMIGIKTRLERGPIKNNTELKKKYEELILDSTYIDLISSQTSDLDRVKRRIELSISKFEDLE